jgi:translocation protein SEC63
VTASDDAIGAISRTSAEKEKAEQLKKDSKGLGTLLKSRGFMINLGITIVLTCIFGWLVMSVKTDGQVNSFDPFSILQIDRGADSKVIKKAYRSLSLKYHPDKNPGNRAAAAKFMMVSKAYESLTDETAKENFEKFGNPDGKQSLEVSIGLPDFLLDTANRNLVLMVYLIIMVGVIPFCVWNYYSDSSKFGEKDVMYDTYSWFHFTLNEHSLMKALPEALAGSAEFRKRNVPKTDTDKTAISTLMNSVRGQMQKPKFNHPVCVKGNVLLHAHLLRKTEEIAALPVALQGDLRYMLQLSNSLMDAMISVCQHQDALQTACNAIEFSQFMTQAMWTKDSTLLQLPHFTAEEVKHCEKGGKGGSNKATSIVEYRQVPDDQKKGMVHFTDAQKKDVSAFLQMLPDITVETKVFVDDDEDDKVYEGDLCTVRVTITRNNLVKGQTAGLVHAPHFPFPKQEAWWIILGTKEGKIIHIEKVAHNFRIFQHPIKFLAPRVGEYDFDLYVKSNAYVGLDQKHKVHLTTLDNAVLPEYKVHPEDAELDDEPTLFEEMLNANIEQDTDDEEDDDSDDDEVEETNKDASTTTTSTKDMIVPKTAAELKKDELNKARKAQQATEGDDSDDDSEGVEEVYPKKK